MAYEHYKKFIYSHSTTIDEENENWSFVDSLDYTPYLNLKIENVYKLMEYIEKDVLNKGIELPQCCDGEFLFNYIDCYEFSNYILNRYPEIVSNVRQICLDAYSQDYAYFFVYKNSIEAKIHPFKWNKLDTNSPKIPDLYFVTIEWMKNLFRYTAMWYDRDNGFGDPRVVAWAEIPKYEG